MTYRDEIAALKSKLDEAETEVALLRNENAALRKGIAPHVADDGRLAPLLGAPMRLRVERTLEGEVPRAAHQKLASIARRAIGRSGTVVSLGNVLLVRMRGRREARFFQLRVIAKDGKTHISVDEDLAQVAGGIFGGVGGGVGFGGLGGILPGLTLALGAWAALVAAPLWLGFAYGLSRLLYGAIVERRRSTHINLVAEIARAAQAGLDEEDVEQPRIRVADSDAEPTNAETDTTDEDGGAELADAKKNARAERR